MAESSKFRSKAIKGDILGHDYSDLPELPSLARERDSEYTKPFKVGPDNLSGPYKRKIFKDLQEWQEYWNANVIQPIYEEFVKEAKKRGLIDG